MPPCDETNLVANVLPSVAITVKDTNQPPPVPVRLESIVTTLTVCTANPPA